MANFTRTIKLTAFQFVPEQLAGVDPYGIEDRIQEELDMRFADIKSAHVNDYGNLSVVFYGSGEEGKTYCEMKPFEWLTSAFGKFEVFNDEKFKEFATPAK